MNLFEFLLYTRSVQKIIERCNLKFSVTNVLTGSKIVMNLLKMFLDQEGPWSQLMTVTFRKSRIWCIQTVIRLSENLHKKQEFRQGRHFDRKIEYTTKFVSHLMIEQQKVSQVSVNFFVKVIYSNSLVKTAAKGRMDQEKNLRSCSSSGKSNRLKK